MQENPYAAPNVDPNASMQRAPGQNGPQDWTVGQALGVGWQAVKDNPFPLVGGFALVAILNNGITRAIQSAMGATPEPGGNPFDALAGMAASMPIVIVVSMYFAIGQFRVALAAARGQAVEFGAFFSGFDRLLLGIVLAIVLYVGIFIGTLLLIIPGLILAFGWAMAIPLLADTKMGVMEILSESWNSMKGHKFHLLGFMFACVGVLLLGVLALIVGVFVALPVIMVGWAEVYMCVTGRRQAEA
jgi:TM2 domain-containing membrane protein YozV